MTKQWDFWRSLWQTGRTGWDQGKEHPDLAILLAHAEREGKLNKPARIYSAGCGRAHGEAYLARQGYQVTAVDAVPEAIAEARLLYGEQPGLELRLADALQVEAGEHQAFDAVYDRAMLCALRPEWQAEYLEACARRLKAGGLFMSILFREVQGAEGPPYAVDELRAQTLFKQDFQLCFALTGTCQSMPSVVQDEWLSIWVKTSQS